MTYDEIIKKVGKRIKKHVYYIKDGLTTRVSDESVERIKFDLQTPLIGTSMQTAEIELKEKIEGEIYVQVEAKYGSSTATKTYGAYHLKEEPTYEASKKTYIHKVGNNLIKSMVDYEPVNLTYPATIFSFFQAVVAKVGYTTNIASLPNGSIQMSTDIFNNIGFTYRDVLDDIAVANGVLFYVESNELKIATLGGNAITINDDILKNQNIQFGEHFGAINTIVLSRSGESDNIYYPAVLPENPIEFKIVDNQLMNENNRDQFLPALYNQLNGIEYDIYDTELTGWGDVKPLQTVNFETGNNTYTSYIFNNEITLTDGYKQAIYNELPEQTETDYKAASKTDKTINQAYIIVRKNEAEIESLARRVIDVSKTINGTGQVQLENAHAGFLHKLCISGQISLLFPSNQDNLYGYPLVPSDDLVPSNTLTPSSPVPYQNEVLYPSTTLYPRGSVLLIDDVEYTLDFDFLNYLSATVYDEFIYEDGKCKIIRRVGIDSSGNKYALDDEIVEYRQPVELLVKSNSIIKLKSFNSAIYSVEYLLENVYTDNFATQVEVSSSITQMAGQIEAKVSQDDVVASINLAMDKGQGVIECKSNQFSVDSDNFKLDRYGNMEANNGTFRGTLNTSENCTVGNDLYIGQNQSTQDQDDKYIKLSETTYLLRTKLWQTLDLLRIRTQDTMYFEISDDLGNPTNALVLNYYDLQIQNINQYIWLHNGYISSSSAIIDDSDVRLKQNIKDVDVSWIDDLKIKEYEFKKFPERKHIGLIAQDYLEKDYKDLFVVKKEDGYYAINYQNITNGLIQYCQELNKKVEKLEKEMEELKNGFSRISK